LHSSGTFVGVVVGSSEYKKSTPASPPPSRLGVILNTKWNEELLMKKSSLVLFVFSIIFFLPRAAFAENFEQLRRDSANIKTVQAGFVQKKQLKILTKPLLSEGRFFYAAPDSFRWEYLKPLRSIVISSKGETKRYIMSGGKMVEDKSGGVQAMRIVMGEVANWMSGKFDRNPSFQASLKEGTNTLITLIPAGQNMAGMIEKIEITLAKKTMTIKSVKIIEGENSATLINFHDVEINKPINSSVFQDVE
jgi:outer membrane lipoprotein-sorting protein